MRKLAIVGLLTLLGLTWQASAHSTTAFATPECFFEPATIVNLVPGAVVVGTGGRDVIYVGGDSPGQTVYGYGGNDLICGDVDDVIYAGAGADWVRADNAAYIAGESGDDSLISHYLFNNGGAPGVVSGGAGNDALVTGGHAQVQGGAGNDVFQSSFDLSCDGGSGTDSLSEGSFCLSTTSIP